MITAAIDRQGGLLSPDELHDRLGRGDRIQVVDVRSPGEYGSGHIPKAINVPMEESEARISDLSQDGAVVLACHSGERAEMTCTLLASKRPGLLVLEGGTEAWIERGFDVVRSTSTRWSLERQVRLAVGVLILISSILALTVHASWAIATAFFGAGLAVAGLTNWCGMGLLIARMPWNSPRTDGTGNGA